MTYEQLKEARELLDDIEGKLQEGTPSSSSTINAALVLILVILTKRSY